jgi:hypothetical protein
LAKPTVLFLGTGLKPEKGLACEEAALEASDEKWSIV